MGRTPIPKTELLDDLQRVSEVVDGHVTISAYREHGEYTEAPFYDRFGDWESALEAADIDVETDLIERGSHGYANVSKGEFLDDVKRVAESMGKTPTIREYQNNGEYSRFLVRGRFGTWNECLKAADLEPNQPASYDVTTREVLTVYYRDGLTMRETATELSITKSVVQYHMHTSSVPPVRSAPIRQLLYSAPRSAELCNNMNKETERKYGVATGDGECWIEPRYIYDEDVLATIEQVLDYFDQ